MLARFCMGLWVFQPQSRAAYERVGGERTGAFWCGSVYWGFVDLYLVMSMMLIRGIREVVQNRSMF